MRLRFITSVICICQCIYRYMFDLFAYLCILFYVFTYDFYSSFYLFASVPVFWSSGAGGWDVRLVQASG